MSLNAECAQDAIERALKKADAVLEELQNTTAGKVRREGAEQLKALRDKKLALQEQEKKKKNRSNTTRGRVLYPREKKNFCPRAMTSMRSKELFERRPRRWW